MGVAWAGDESSYRAFIERHGITFPTVDDTPGEVFATLNVSGQPSYAFVDGDRVERTFGSLDDDGLRSRIDSMLRD